MKLLFLIKYREKLKDVDKNKFVGTKIMKEYIYIGIYKLIFFIYIILYYFID